MGLQRKLLDDYTMWLDVNNLLTSTVSTRQTVDAYLEVRQQEFEYDNVDEG